MRRRGCFQCKRNSRKLFSFGGKKNAQSHHLWWLVGQRAGRRVAVSHVCGGSEPGAPTETSVALFSRPGRVQPPACRQSRADECALPSVPSTGCVITHSIQRHMWFIAIVY